TPAAATSVAPFPLFSTELRSAIAAAASDAEATGTCTIPDNLPELPLPAVSVRTRRLDSFADPGDLEEARVALANSALTAENVEAVVQAFAAPGGADEEERKSAKVRIVGMLAAKKRVLAGRRAAKSSNPEDAVAYAKLLPDGHDKRQWLQVAADK
ncbi:hypothetical protein HK405_002312, partial [Cladochytrium tenue]